MREGGREGGKGSEIHSCRGAETPHAAIGAPLETNLNRAPPSPPSLPPSVREERVLFLVRLYLWTRACVCVRRRGGGVPGIAARKRAPPATAGPRKWAQVRVLIRSSV